VYGTNLIITREKLKIIFFISRPLLSKRMKKRKVKKIIYLFIIKKKKSSFFPYCADKDMQKKRRVKRKTIKNEMK
jgi:hypothetical protein